MKYKYEIIIYWSENDKFYKAEAPELAGCKSDGDTYLAAIKNLQLVIDEWIDTAKSLNREIPKPKGKLMFA